jgi:hypothetical protein
MIVDFLLSRDGLRIDHVDLAISGLRLASGTGPDGRSTGLAPRTADSVEGAVRLTLADLSAAFARPEILDQLLARVGGVARPELALTEAGDGSLRLTGSIELMGRRFPVSAVTALSVVDDRVVVSLTRLEGLPVLGALTSQLPSFALPLVLPAGLHFTDVRTERGAVVVGFAGTDVRIGPDAPLPAPDPEAVEPHREDGS